MRVRTVVSAGFQSNVHVVDLGSEALIVDAGSAVGWASFEADLRRALGKLAARKLYLTHWHVDHVGGAARIKAMTGAEALIHTDEAIAVEKGDARLTLGAFAGLPQEACPVTHVKEGDVVEAGGRRFEVLLVPGHSPAHTALWEPESRSLFSGDVAFAGGAFGRVDFPGCDPRKLVRSLEKLAGLDAANLYAGHMENVEGRAADAIAESLDNARAMLGGGFA